MNWEDTVMSEEDIRKQWQTLYDTARGYGHSQLSYLGLVVERSLLLAQAKITWDIAERQGFEREQSTVLDWLPK